MTWAWAFFLVYAVSTGLLAWRSNSGTESASSFAIGSGRMNPWMAGITLGACLASSSTFAIMPGFVYSEGLPALIGFSLPLIAGIAVGLFSLAYRFQTEGARFGALTVPHWLGARYESQGLRRFFAGLNVLNIAYLVLITVGCGYVMESALGVSYAASVIGIVTFVFAYTGLGGANAHAWTNSLQGVVMLAVAVALFLSGASHWPAMAADLGSTGMVSEGSVMFGSLAEVWVVPFGMGFALTTQPHLLSKALYVQGRRELTLTLTLGVATFAVFCLVLFAGAYARLVLPAEVPQDAVMARYLQVAFSSPVVTAGMSIAILAAAMSTMDGLLVAVAASVGNDVFAGKGSVWVNRLVLVALAGITIGVALFPPKLVLVLGQLGVYGLVAASSGPLIVGMFARGALDVRFAFASAITALSVHFGLAMLQPNPGVAALVAIAVAVPVAAMGPLLGNSVRGALPDAARPATMAEVSR